MAFKTGIEKHAVDGKTVSVYSREKTLADCFSRRNEVGLDVAFEALKFYMAQGKAKVDLIMSDDGTETLAFLTRLEWLYLNRTKVTNASMQKFSILRELKFLSLLGTSITDSGVAELHALVPSVRVRR